MASFEWWRSWHGAPMDAKWLVIAKRAQVAPGVVSAVAWSLFDYASQANPRGSVTGFDVETYATFSGFAEADIEAVIEAMKVKGVIGEDGRLANWDKRQPKREDDSRDRVRAFRRREAEKDAMKRTVTQSNDREDKDKDKDTESEAGGLGGAHQAPAAKAASELPTDAEWAAAFQGFEAAIGRVTSGYTLQEMRETFDELRAANRLDWWQAAIDETVRCEGNSWTYMARVIDGSTKRGMKPGERRVNGGRQAYEDRKSADYKLKMAIILGDDSGITADGGLGAWPSIGRVS